MRSHKVTNEYVRKPRSKCTKKQSAGIYTRMKVDGRIPLLLVGKGEDELKIVAYTKRMST